MPDPWLARRVGGLVLPLALLAVAGCSGGQIAGHGTAAGAQAAPSGTPAALPDLCVELPRGPAGPLVAGLAGRREHTDGQESCTWEKNEPDGTVSLQVSVRARRFVDQAGVSGSDAAATYVQGLPGEMVDLSPVVEQARLRAVLGPRDPRLTTVTVRASRGTVAVDVTYVTLGSSLEQAKDEAGALTQAALETVDSH